MRGFAAFSAFICLIFLINVVVLRVRVRVCDRSVAFIFVGFFMKIHFSCPKVWLEAESAFEDGLSFE
jgi:hypothetical protein